MRINTPRFATLASIILAASLVRLLPHPYNFTPIGAMALFGGAYLGSKRWAMLVPLLALLVSDLVLGFHNTMWAVYGSVILTVALGMGFLKKITAGRVAGAAVLSSVLFFLITNFAVWLTEGTLYPKTFMGLMACYGAGLQFYQYDFFGNLFFNSIMGDLFFSLILFGGFEWLKSKAPVLRAAA